MQQKPYILAIGDIVTDAFIELDETQAKATVDEQGNHWLTMPLGTKPPYKKVDIIQAVGNSANAAVAMSRLGLEAGLMAYLGDDQAGKDSLDYLHSEGVDTSTVSVASGMKSNYHYVLRYSAERTILIKYEDYDYAWQEPARVPDWIYLSMLSQDSWHLHEQVMEYLNAHPETKLVFQPGTFHFEWGTEKLAALYARAHIVFMNKEEAMVVTKQQTQDIEKLVEGLHNLGVKIAVVTDGPHGAYASDGARVLSIPNYPDPAEPSDRTGAGDAFASTVTAALALGKDLETALQWAPINSMNVCQHLGAQAGLLHMDDISNLLAKAPADYKLSTIAGEHELSMEEVAAKLVENPKGIFAADQSGGSLSKQFATYDIEFTEENRRIYRQFLFTTPQIEHYVSGVILFDETAHQSTDDGTKFVDLLASRGMIPGVKVDGGIVDLAGFPGEGVTSGLDGLPERLQEYRQMGIRFAKWRAAFIVSEHTPSDAAIAANVHSLARYARDCQVAGIVPIVEPEIVHDGDFDIETCQHVTAKVLDILFDELALMGVNLQALLLKTSMVLAGSTQTQSTPEEVAQATVATLREHVPQQVAGIVFLSGGQTPEQATENLQAITNLGEQAWPITFSYSRVLQEPTLERWAGEAANIHAAQETFLARVKASSQATIRQDTSSSLY
jgi:fructose-bisphosphate aldolase class I